ncbi:hypothetical protein T484DRAFT_1912254, partial [Baffinella frigidus]
SIVVGASTACVCTLDTSQAGYTYLNGVNIGDSGVTIVRRGADGALAVIHPAGRLVAGLPGPVHQDPLPAPRRRRGNRRDRRALRQRLRVADPGFDGGDVGPGSQLSGAGARVLRPPEPGLVPYGIEAQEAKEPWRGGQDGRHPYPGLPVFRRRGRRGRRGGSRGGCVVYTSSIYVT